MSVTKKTNAPSASPHGPSPLDLKWRHYSQVMDKFRRLCHSDKVLFQQAEDKIKGKRVAEAYQRHPKGAIDPFSLAKAMTDYVLDLEDERQVDKLYRAKLAFRDRICVVLGKDPDEKWDAFYGRHNTNAKIPNVVRQYEMAEGAVK